MKTANVRDLRNDLLRSVEAGEEVVIQRRGRAVPGGNGTKFRSILDRKARSESPTYTDT